jgi:hypothetical protein
LNVHQIAKLTPGPIAFDGASPSGVGNFIEAVSVEFVEGEAPIESGMCRAIRAGRIRVALRCGQVRLISDG